MGVFIFIYIAFIGIYLITNNKIGRKREIQAVLCFLLLWLIQGLRHSSVGIDSVTSYRPYFESLSVSWDSLFDFKDSFANFEIGYIVFNKLFKFFISTDPQLFILACSFISIAPIAWVIYKYSPNIIFSFWVYASFQLYHFGFSGIRQSIAIGICTLAYNFIVQKKIPVFIALVLLASTFHTSAILFLPAYWIYHKLNMSPKMLVVYILMIFVLMFTVKSVAITLVSLIFGGKQYLGALEESAVPSYNLLIIFILIFISTYISRNEELAKLRSFVLMTVAFQTLGLFTTHATRIGYYYFVFFALAIPYAIETSNLKCKGLIRGLLAMILAIFFFYVNGGGYLEVIPYKFFWE
ncbi:MAG: EpsG family protein [Prevotella sp.]|nr:EpsG family protein [Prevotella sp.]